MPQPLPAHVQWLVDNRGPALSALLEAAGVDLEPAEAMSVLVAADPSPGAHAVQWLCDTLLAHGFLWEDVEAGVDSKVSETLVWFAQHRAGLPRGQRNLENYSDLAGIYTAVAPMLERELDGDDQPSGRDARRRARQQAYGDSIVVHKSPDMMVAVPLSMQASQWWGRGTRWCTAAEKSNYFDRYNKTAPLIVILLRGDSLDSEDAGVSKLQLHIDPDDGTSFMDATDSNVTPAFVRTHWTQLEPIMTWALGMGANLERHIPHGLWRGKIAQILVTRGSSYLGKIEPSQRSPDICMAAVTANGMALEHVPPELRNEAICRVALSSRGMAITQVPQELMTPAMCLLAVQSTPSAISYIPQHLHSHELALAAVGGAGRCLFYLDQPLNFDICLAAVANDVSVLSHALDQDFDSGQRMQLYMAAVICDGKVLEEVPASFHTTELYLAAVRSAPDVFRHIPRRHVTPELVAAAAAGGTSIRHVAHRHLTPQLCATAVAANSAAYCLIPSEMRDRALSELAVRDNGSQQLQYVPTKLVTPELCALAVASCPDAIQYVPLEMQTPELIARAVEINGGVIMHLRNRELPQNVYMEALRQEPWNITQIPTDYISIEIYEYAISLRPRFVTHVPGRFMSLDFCTRICTHNSDLVSMIPTMYRDEVRAALAAMPRSLLPPSKPRIGRKWVPEVALAGLDTCLADPAGALGLGQPAPVDSLPGLGH